MSNSMSKILSLSNISKSFSQGRETISVLNNLSLEVSEGQSIAIVGESGCGKSTLLQIIGLLMDADQGDIEIRGEKLTNSSDKLKTNARLNNVGFIFQYHHLLSDFTALENVSLPQVLLGKSQKAANENSLQLLERLGLSDRINHRPSELSGGQQQRVAIARALSNNPKLILADEPTGNLDPENTELVTNLFFDITKEHNSALVIVTHNREISKKTNIIYNLKDGKLA